MGKKDWIMTKANKCMVIYIMYIVPEPSHDGDRKTFEEVTST